MLFRSTPFLICKNLTVICRCKFLSITAGNDFNTTIEMDTCQVDRKEIHKDFRNNIV